MPSSTVSAISGMNAATSDHQSGAGYLQQAQRSSSQGSKVDAAECCCCLQRPVLQEVLNSHCGVSVPYARALPAKTRPSAVTMLIPAGAPVYCCCDGMPAAGRDRLTLS